MDPLKKLIRQVRKEVSIKLEAIRRAEISTPFSYLEYSTGHEPGRLQAFDMEPAVIMPQMESLERANGYPVELLPVIKRRHTGRIWR